jgi:hypothetical protein
MHTGAMVTEVTTSTLNSVAMFIGTSFYELPTTSFFIKEITGHQKKKKRSENNKQHRT